MEIEIILSAAAIFFAALSAIHSLRLSIKRARMELIIREKLDNFASKNSSFNTVVRDANIAFNDDGDPYPEKEIQAFRRALDDQVRGAIASKDNEIFDDIIRKNDDQMVRYSERVAHSIAGRRTRLGKFSEKIIIFFLRLFGVWTSRR